MFKKIMNKRKSSDAGSSSYSNLEEPLYGEIRDNFEKALSQCALSETEVSQKKEEASGYSIEPFILKSYENLTSEMNKSSSYAEEQDANLNNWRSGTFSNFSKSLVNLPPDTKETKRVPLEFSHDQLRKNNEREVNIIRVMTLMENYGPSAAVPIQKYVSSTHVLFPTVRLPIKFGSNITCVTAIVDLSQDESFIDWQYILKKSRTFHL